MKRVLSFSVLALLLVSIGAYVGQVATAESPVKEKEAAAEPELPPGWTKEDMALCMEACTPGEMHKHLAKQSGKWNGKVKTWMMPGAQPLESEATIDVSLILDGRYSKVDFVGEIPGMGPFTSLGLFGYDNVLKKFTSVWVSGQSTSMMTGTGELSEDGKVMKWSFTTSCPLTKKPTTVREIETITGPHTKTLQTFVTDPKTNKEYQMMEIDMTRQTPM